MNIENMTSEWMTKHTNTFVESAKEVKTLDHSLWSQLISVQAIVLGISISLLSYQNLGPNGWLIASWFLEVICICLGFSVMALDAKYVFKTSFYNYMFSLDMNDILMRDNKGGFLKNPDRKKGLLLAAIVKNPFYKSGIQLTEDVQRQAKKYEHELESSKLFKDTKSPLRSKIAAMLLPHRELITDAFYLSFLLSFIALLLSLIL